MQTAYEIVAEPVEVFVAPVGTRPPALSATPGAEWKSLGRSVDQGVTALHSVVPQPWATPAGAYSVKQTRVSEQMELSMALDCKPERVNGLGFIALLARGISCIDASSKAQFEIDRAYLAQPPTVRFSRLRSEVELTFYVDLGFSAGGRYRVVAGGVAGVGGARPVAVRAAAAQWLTSYLLKNGLTPMPMVVADAEQVGMPVEVLERAAQDLHVGRRHMFMYKPQPLPVYVPEGAPLKSNESFDDVDAVEGWVLPGALKELLEANDEYWDKEINRHDD